MRKDSIWEAFKIALTSGNLKDPSWNSIYPLLLNDPPHKEIIEDTLQMTCRGEGPPRREDNQIVAEIFIPHSTFSL